MSPLIVESTSGKALATLIFLHGLGDTGNGWLSAIKYLAKSLPQFRFILPTAPTRPVTLNSGIPMPAWYDLYSLSHPEAAAKVDTSGIKQSISRINTLVESEHQVGRKVILGGFSQGAAIALQSALENPMVSAVVALSGYYALPNEPVMSDNKALRVFMAHGTEDFVVQHDWGRKSAEAVRAKGFDVTFKSYPGMAHESSMQELNDVLAFLHQQLLSFHSEI